MPKVSKLLNILNAELVIYIIGHITIDGIFDKSIAKGRIIDARANGDLI